MSVELDGANNIVKTDTISEVTSANGVTIDGLSIKDSKLVTANSVIEANMSADSVDSDSYVDGSIDSAHIADGQVTIGKLATAVLTGATDIGADVADADLFLVDDGAGGTLRKTAASRLKTYVGAAILSGSTNNTVATVTGANALIGEATMTYDATTLAIIPAGAQSNIRLQSATSGSGSTDGFLIQETGLDTYLVNYENAGMYFRTNNTDHMQITAGGAVLIKQGIYAISDTNTGIQFDGSDLMTFHTGGTEHFRIAADGTLTGTDTSIGSNSDSRVKENIADFTYDLTKFKQLKPRTFDWKNPSQHNGLTDNRGFIAQEIKAIDDYWVGELKLKDNHADYSLIPEDEDGNHMSYTSKLGKKDAMYISVINQLITKIETLETKVTALEAD